MQQEGVCFTVQDPLHHGSSSAPTIVLISMNNTSDECDYIFRRTTYDTFTS